MLIHVHTLTKNTEASVRGIVLNTNFIDKLQTINGVTTFNYLSKPEDRKGGWDKYTVSETAAVILADMELAPTQAWVTVPVYDVTYMAGGTTNTTFLFQDIISVVRAPVPYDNGYGTRSILTVNHRGAKAVWYLCEAHYLDFVSIGATGSSSTTTSSTSTSSTSSTSTSSTSSSSTSSSSTSSTSTSSTSSSSTSSTSTSSTSSSSTSSSSTSSSSTSSTSTSSTSSTSTSSTSSSSTSSTSTTSTSTTSTTTPGYVDRD